MEEGNWVVLESDGWRIVMPQIDTKPHSTQIEGVELELAWSKCPCEPKVDFSAQMIVHNSFEDTEKIDEAIKQIENT